MLRDFLSNRVVLAALGFCVLIVGGSLFLVTILGCVLWLVHPTHH